MDTNRSGIHVNSRESRRRGVSLVVVVMMLSIAMGVSFAVVYSQGTATRIQQYADLRGDARQAAQAGMAVALREACQSDWAGVDTSFSRDLDDGASFSASYAAGDDTLGEEDEDYAEYPYRITVLVTGRAFDPMHSERKAQHAIRAVIRLIPQAVGDEPAGWSDVQDNTFCQREKDYLYVAAASRITGQSRIRGRLYLSKDGMYWSDTARWWYMKHLNYMRYNGWPDYRPFNGPLRITRSEQDYDTLNLLEGALDISLSDASSSTIYTWTMPLVGDGYRLYPGGKIYYAAPINTDNSDAEFKADPITNPLGIFTGGGETRFSGNVTFEGALISNGDVRIIAGANNSFTSPSVPPYSHRDMPEDIAVRLPTVVTNDDFKVETGASVEVKGLLMAKEQLELKSDYQYNMLVSIQGKVLAKKLNIKPRVEWQKSRDWWDQRLTTYMTYYYYSWYFPEWIQSVYGIDPEPHIVIEPDAQTTRYHWYDGNNPLFRQAKDAGGNDSGLRWELISWRDNP